MPDDVSDKVSAFAKKHKVVVWGGIAIGGIAAVLIWRRQAANSAANATSPTATSATGTGTIDPTTGLPEGSPEDQAALQSFYGDGFSQVGGGGFNPWPVSQPAPTGGGGTTTAVSTNDQWLIAAEKSLPNGHSAAVETALARVLGGLTVTWAQRALFLEAQGIVGQPPQGYPKPIKLANGGGDTGGSHQKVVVPEEVGKLYMAAAADLEKHGLKSHFEGRGEIRDQKPAAGEEVRRGTVVHLFGASRAPKFLGG
jgi:hypothetical protein